MRASQNKCLEQFWKGADYIISFCSACIPACPASPQKRLFKLGQAAYKHDNRDEQEVPGSFEIRSQGL